MQVVLPLVFTRRLPSDTADQDILNGREDSGFDAEHAKLKTATWATPQGGNSGFTIGPCNKYHQSKQAPKAVRLTYSVQHSPSSEVNQFAASQEIPRVLWNPNMSWLINTRSQLSLHNKLTV